MKNKRIGLFGGSFNPIHNSHLKLINTVLNKKIVDEVWIIPCKNHPFDKELASAEDRINMINFAIQKIPHVKLNDIEIKSEEKSYTYNTVMKLKEKNLDKEFYFIIGADILHEFINWYKSEELLKEIQFILFWRGNYLLEKISGMKITELVAENSDNLSSSKIRSLVLKNKSISGLVPKEVENYIIQRELYK